MKKIYLASPLGFSEIGREFYYSKLIPELKKLGFEILDPWKLTPQEKVDKILNLPYSAEKKLALSILNKEIAKNNLKAIQEADILIGILDGVDIDSGTASEIGFAYGLSKRIYGYRGDFRLSGDNEGSKVNLQVQYFIENSSGAISHSLKELLEKIKEETIIN